jgi:hypothetical protein
MSALRSPQGDRTPAWRRYLRFWRRDLAADVDDELSFHLAHRVEQYEASGMSHDAAVAAAGAQLGDEESVRATIIGIDRRVARTNDVTLWLDSLRSDLYVTSRSFQSRLGTPLWRRTLWDSA